MSELIYCAAVSEDGFIAGPQGQFDALPAEGDHVAGFVERFPDAIPSLIAEHLGIDQSTGRFSAVLMGWHTYAVGFPHGMVSPYAHLEQIVFSRRHGPADVPGGGDQGLPRITDEDPETVLDELLARVPGDVWLCGGGALASSLRARIDRLVLKRNPVVFGSGIPLFAPGAYEPRAWRRDSTRVFDSGVVTTELVRAEPNPTA